MSWSEDFPAITELKRWEEPCHDRDLITAYWNMLPENCGIFLKLDGWMTNDFKEEGWLERYIVEGIIAIGVTKIPVADYGLPWEHPFRRGQTIRKGQEL